MKKLILTAAMLLYCTPLAADFQCDDRAKMFSNRQKEECNDKLEFDEYWAPYNLRVETYDDLDEEELIEAFESQWKKLGHQGIFIVIDRKSRMILIRGSRRNATEEILIPTMRRVLRAFFREDDFDGGLRAVTLLFKNR